MGALHFGWPPGLACRSVAKMAPDFPRDSLVSGTLISIYSSTLRCWSYRCSCAPTPAYTTNWAFGITLLWCLAVILWQPWFAYTRTTSPLPPAQKVA